MAVTATVAMTMEAAEREAVAMDAHRCRGRGRGTHGLEVCGP
jgi:hypothetical protein